MYRKHLQLGGAYWLRAEFCYRRFARARVSLLVAKEAVTATCYACYASAACFHMSQNETSDLSSSSRLTAKAGSLEGSGAALAFLGQRRGLPGLFWHGLTTRERCGENR